MLKKRIIPLLLLKKGRMVKGKKFSNFIDTGNPNTAVRVYTSQDADELIFLDVEASLESRNILLDTIKSAAKECNMPLSVGGGINSVDDVRQILLAGADKVVITSSIIDNPSIIEDVAKKFGSQCIVAGIDYRIDLTSKSKSVWKNCGTKITKYEPLSYAKILESSGVGEIFLNSINNDGMMNGYDLETASEISSAVKNPLIVCGGAGNFQHIVDLFKNTEASAAACSSLFHFGDNNPIRARSHLRNYKIEMRIVK